MDKQKNAYFFFRDNQLYRFLYIKLKPTNMAKALPITYESDDDKCYITVIFDPDGRDYLCQCNESEIKNIVKE